MINTTLCYIERGEEYLMLHRVKKKNDINHDKWIGVGGKFEARESPEDCLLREVREETGLTLTRWRYRAVVTFVAGPEAEAEYMHLFTADGFTGTIKTCEEGNLEWISRKRLQALPMWEGDKIFLRLLDENAPFFSLKLIYDGDRLIEAVLDGRPVTADDAVLRTADNRAAEPLLISACLLGAACRYDGKAQGQPWISRLQECYHLIPICPEQLGGLPTPRTPAERVGDTVLTRDGRDVTEPYAAGAEEALRLAELFGCKKALLKERSPSCGHGMIYDGTFTGTKIAGSGVAAQRLAEAGLEVIGESRWEELL